MSQGLAASRAIRPISLVLGLLAVGFGTAFNQPASAVVLQQKKTPVALQAITVTPTTVVGSGAKASGTLTLSGPAPIGGFIVNLSSDTASVSVPSSVTFPYGATEENFKITTVAVNQDTIATITASLNAVTIVAKLTVTETIGLQSLGLTPGSVPGGTQAKGTVILDSPAPKAGIVVTLYSSSAAVNIPAYATVAGGTTTTSFAIATTAVYSNITATITATLGNSVANAQIGVTSSGIVKSISVAPTSVSSGSLAKGIVILTTPAPSTGTVVNLSSTNPAAKVPATVTVPGGATSATFTITTTTVISDTQVTITATTANTPATPPTATTPGTNPPGTNPPGTTTGATGATGTSPTSATITVKK